MVDAEQGTYQGIYDKLKNVVKNWTYLKGEIDTLLNGKSSSTHTHGNLQNDGKVGASNNASKNVVTDSNGKITTEDKPSIPSASSTTPSADTTNGSVGTGTTWARSNHTHPKSSIYAESTHSHTKSDISDFPSFHTVATSGSYNDLTNKPNIPSGVVVDTSLDSTSDHAISNSAVATALNGKSDTGHTHNQYLTSSDISGKIDTAGTGLSKNGTTLNHSNSVTAQNSEVFKKFKYDATGHITGVSDVTSSDLPTHTHSQYITSAPTDVSELTDNNNTPFTPKTHNHGNLQDDGKMKINGTAQTSKNVVTDSSGNITTESKPNIPSKTSDLTNDSGFLTSHQDISGKLDIAQTSYKGKNVVVDSSTGNITFEDKNNHTHNQYLTEHQSLTNYIQKSSTNGLVKNDGTIDQSSYLTVGTASSTYVAKETGKGLFSGSYSDLTNKPSYTPTVTSSTTGSYEIGKININGSDVTIYGKDTDTHQSLANYVQKSNTVGLIKNDGTIDENTYSLSSHNHNGVYSEIGHTHSAYVNPTIVTDEDGWNSTLSDEEIPSEKLVKNSLDDITITDFGIDDTDVDNIELYIEIGEQTEQSFVFYDDCTTNNTSQYSDVIKFTSTSASATLSFNSNSTDYSFVGSGGDYFVGRVIPTIRGEDNIRISVKVKLTNNSAYNQFFIGLSDNLSYSSGNSFTADMFRIRGDNKSDYLHNSGNEVSGSSSTTSVYNNWVIVVFERNGTSITGKIYDSSNTLIREYSYTTANSYTNPYYFIGLNARDSSSTKEISEIKVERM